MRAAEARGKSAPQPARPSCAYADALARLGRGRRVRRRGALRHRRDHRARPAVGQRPRPAGADPLRRPAEALRAGAAAARPATRCCCSTSRTTSSTCPASAGWRRGCASRPSRCSTSRTTGSCWPRPPTGWSPSRAAAPWVHPGGFAVLARGAGGPARPARRAAPPLGRGAPEAARADADVQAEGGVQRRAGLALPGRADPAAQVRGGRAAAAAAEGPGHPDAAGRRADRQARGHLRAARAGRT